MLGCARDAVLLWPRNRHHAMGGQRMLVVRTAAHSVEPTADWEAQS